MGAIKRFRGLELKRKLALVLAPGALVLGADAAVAHFAGRTLIHPAQAIPVAFGPLAALLLGVAATAALGVPALRRLFRTVGALGVAVGLTGTGFHLRALARLLEPPFRLEDLGAALAVAPPLFAPGAFLGIGALLWALGSPRLTLAMREPETAPPLGELRPAF